MTEQENKIVDLLTEINNPELAIKLKAEIFKYAQQQGKETVDSADVVKSFTAEDVVNELKENETLDDAISYFDNLK